MFLNSEGFECFFGKIEERRNYDWLVDAYSQLINKRLCSSVSHANKMGSVHKNDISVTVCLMFK